MAPAQIFGFELDLEFLVGRFFLVTVVWLVFCLFVFVILRFELRASRQVSFCYVLSLLALYNDTQAGTNVILGNQEAEIRRIPV
jgi:hypothetical protein